MTTKTLAEKIKVMQWKLDNPDSEIVITCHHYRDPFRTKDPSWDWDSRDYDIPPQSLEAWLVFSHDGKLMMALLDEITALSYLPHGGRIVHVKEVG